MGDVPLEWYQGEEHIGYDKDGQRLLRGGGRDRLDQLLDRNDADRWRTVYDDYNDEEVRLRGSSALHCGPACLTAPPPPPPPSIGSGGRV